MIYYKHYETHEPQCVSKSIEEFLKCAKKKFPKLLVEFQKLKVIEKVNDETIIGIALQSLMNGTVTLWTSAVLVYQK